MKLRRTHAVPLLAAMASTVPVSGTGALAAARHAHHRGATATSASASIRELTVAGSSIVVSGGVRLSRNTGSVRRRTRVVITATASSGAPERRIVSISRKLTYKATWATGLTGTVTVTVRAAVSGEPSGKTVKRTVTIAQPVTPPAGGGTALIGTFKLDAGAAPSGAQPTGSFFEMLTGSGGPLANLSSPAPNKDYTPLAPGTAGGFSTAAYQPSPNPAFAGGSSGNALANAIIQPVPFYLINFSVETSASDAQTGGQDPLPKIIDTDGALSGQITAWVAQWNGQSFNQGTPKPNGTLPAPTTPLTGTYDATTHRFALAWKSLIVGGPFNGFTGVWHLAGTFVPAPGGSSSPLLPPLPLLN